MKKLDRLDRFFWRGWEDLDGIIIVFSLSMLFTFVMFVVVSCSWVWLLSIEVFKNDPERVINAKSIAYKIPLMADLIFLALGLTLGRLLGRNWRGKLK